MLSRRTVLVSLASLPFLSGTRNEAHAAEKPILTLRLEKGGEPIRLDIAALDALPQTSFETTTPWHQGKVRFSGVAFSSLMEAFEIEEGEVRLVALNDYMVESGTLELTEGGALLATRADGETMPISDKGPVFLVFPFDAKPEVQHQSYYSRSVWQLTEIDILQ